MSIKSWFGGGGKQEQKAKQDQEYTIDDLIVLERYDEACERLKSRLKLNPADLHMHLKLAEVYAGLKQYDKAVDEFGFVAEEYSQDGFYEKGIALLSKAQKLAPMDQSLRFRIERIQREQRMEHVRAIAIEGLRAAGGQKAGTSALEVKRLWHHLAATQVVQRLPGDQLKRLFSAMELTRLDANAVVAEEGAADQFLLLIVTGVVEAFYRDASGKDITVRTFTSGDIVGEGSLLERTAWPAGYRVAEPGTALKLTREGLEKTLVGNPDPRQFLEVLREQHNDRDLAATLRRLHNS
ncbi:MAG TPA: cyclic nucleotide-binding domain-containing protein [Thermoanaerobaculia bacterium]|nr:cyclic nucleotide-binding domain-containing protein [Thermoanaerobaculia bacterium]